MVLVFGGTTEGRKAVEVLEEAGNAYYYSTKTGEQDIALHHGQRIDGALDEEAMRAFCQEHGIRLMVDAAHPFASQLHQTIANVSETLAIPVVRYERIYPPRDPEITWIDDYSQVPTDIHSLLATTGVQSISKLKWLEAKGIKVYYRILPRESSVALARQQGATDDQLCFFNIPVVGEASKLCSSSIVGEASKLCSSSIVGEASKLCSSSIVGEASKLCGATAAKLGSFTHYDAILLKESGVSGGFQEKVDEAKAQGMRIIALKRPDAPTSHLLTPDSQLLTVNGPYGLRRAVEKLLPAFFPLHSGLTTGTCATAAAVAATLRLLKNETPGEVPVMLPNGETISVPVGYADGYAYCIKEAGDDPDVTNGLEIRASVACKASQRNNIVGHASQRDTTEAPPTLADTSSCPVIEILGGEGVGIFTLPGFDYPPGSPAINKAPREMIRQNLEALVGHASKRDKVVGHASKRDSVVGEASKLCNAPVRTAAKLGSFTHFQVTISVPEGAEIARRTFNPRLGIEGGISIIGVSGIVKPFSEEAFIDSIRKCMTVAKASGSDHVVINSGGKSERFVKALYPTLPQQAFVEYGNYIGETLKMASELGFRHVTLGVMLGKAVKLAAGHLDTHSRKATMDKRFIRQMLEETHIATDLSEITLARELWEKIPSDQVKTFAATIIRHCAEHCRPLLPNAILTVLLIDDNGKIYEV